MMPPQHRILLTGGSGTLGRNFLDLVAADESIEVVGLLRQDSRCPPTRERQKFVRIDFNAPNSADAVLAEFRPTCFVHAAATGMNFPKPEWFDLIRFNVSVSLNFCQSISHYPSCSFVYISTGLVYRELDRASTEQDAIDTLHPYGASKASADMLVRSAAVEFGVPLTVLRPFSFTGLWDDQTRLFPSILRAAAEGKAIDLSPGDQVRDHCSARDIAGAILASVKTPPPKNSTKPRIFNVGSSETTPLRPLIERVRDALKLKVDLNFGARPYGRHEPKYLAANIEAAGRDLGWRPRHNLSHAVWQLARESFPSLQVQEPPEFISPHQSLEQQVSP